MTVNTHDSERPKLMHNDNRNDDRMMAQLVNSDDGDDNRSIRQQAHEMDERSDVFGEKEGRAINFPLEILSNNQSSTEPGHMQINLVKSSTDKPHVMSFFDLSDVSMDHEEETGDDDEYSNVKKDKKQQFMSKDKIDGDNKKNECSFNGTNYKVSHSIHVIHIRVMLIASNHHTRRKFFIIFRCC